MSQQKRQQLSTGSPFPHCANGHNVVASNTNASDVTSATGCLMEASPVHPPALLEQGLPGEPLLHTPASAPTSSLQVETYTDSLSISLRSVPAPRPFLKSVRHYQSIGQASSDYLNGSVWAKYPSFSSHTATVCRGLHTTSSNGTATSMGLGSWLSATKVIPTTAAPSPSSAATSSRLLTALAVDCTHVADGDMLTKPEPNRVMSRAVSIPLRLTADQKNILRVLGKAANQVHNKTVRYIRAQTILPLSRRDASAGGQ